MVSPIKTDVDQSADLQPIVVVKRMQEHPTPPTQEGSPSSSQNTIISTMHSDNHNIDPNTLNQKLLETSIEQNRSRELEALDALEQSIKIQRNEVNRQADLQIAQSSANSMLNRNATFNNSIQKHSQHKIGKKDYRVQVALNLHLSKAGKFFS